MPTFNLQVGQSILLQASILDQNNNQMVQSGKQACFADWGSSDEAIATVSSGPGSSRGTVTGIAAGSATITASYTDANGNPASQDISVVVYEPAASSIQIIYPLQ